MSDNFQSYQSFVPPTEAPSQPTLQVRVVDAVNRVSIGAGNVTETAPLANAKGNAGELNPFHDTSSIFASARNANGSPVTVIQGDTLVTIGGTQAPVSFWVSEGILQQAPDGSYGEGKPQAAEQEANGGDLSPLPDLAMSEVNAALAPVEQSLLDGLAAFGTGVAIGRLDGAGLVTKFQQASGCDSDEAHARLTTIKAAYQAQADGALTSRSGIAPADIQHFYIWAKENHQGQLQEAVQRQIHGHDVSGYKALASEWLAKTAPSLAALKAAGVTTRKQGNGVEAFVQGSWMTPSAAARAGLI